MPDPPTVNVFTRYVLENPWPLGLGLLLLAGWLAWSGTRAEQIKRIKLAGILGLSAAVVLILGILITTAGEQAKALTRQLVDAAVNRDTVGAMALFSDEAVLSAGSPRNPGFGYDFIVEKFDLLATRYNIDSNMITMLKAYTESRDAATVHLGCLTSVSQFPYPNTSRWVVQVRKQSDGSWKIVHLTCVSINDQTPPLDRLW